jgi:hypothetical protein
LIAFLLRVGRRVPATDDRGRTLVRGWLEQHPMLTDTSVHSWTSADGLVSCHWGGHGPDDLGGVPYSAEAEAANAFALFCGRPVRWRDGDADGLAGIDASGYLSAPATWSHELDGRYCVIRVDDRDVHVRTDAGLPVYSSRRAGAIWISNMASLVAPAAAVPRPRALAALLACGWGITGEPLCEDVDRLATATLHTFARDTSATAELHRQSYADILATEPDYKEAARMVVSLAQGHAKWPGRPLEFGLTGGRDSRLIAAALRGAGLKPTAYTLAYAGQVGYPETGDVLLARRIAGMLGWSHSVVPISEDAPVYSRLPAVMDILRLTSPQTTSLADFQDVTELVPWGSTPRILVDGVGGEIGRGAWAAYLGGDYPGGDTVDAVTKAVLRKITPASPAPLVSPDGLALVRHWMKKFVQTQVDQGVALRDVPEVLHIERQATWHGPNLANRWHREDAFSMYLSPRLWPHMVGKRRGGARSGEFHREVLNLLGPDLAELPYEAGQTTWLYDNAVGRTLDRERRLAYAIPVEPIGAIRDAARAAVASYDDHPAWSVLDRRRVAELLRYSPDQFRGVERYQLWSLATAFHTPNGEMP